MAKQLNQSATVNMVFTADASQAKAQIASLQKDLSNLMTKSFSSSGVGQGLSQYSTDIAKLQSVLKSSINEFGKIDLGKFQKSLSSSGLNLTQLQNSLSSMGPAGSAAFNKLSTSVMQAEMPIRSTNKLLAEMKTTLANSARWTIASSAIKAFQTGISNAYNYAQDLNESLTDIRIVSGKSADEMARFAVEANKVAKELNTTTKNYSDASLIYFQQGLSEEAVKQRTDITIKMANAAGENAEKVSSQLTAVWNNFDDGSKSLEYFADVMVKLGAYTASSTDEISAGLQKFAPIAKTVGLSYEYAASAIATITATTRESADTVGTSLKTIFSRIQGLSLGETLDDGTDLNKYSKALKTIGIDIKDASGNLKDMDIILDELGGKWGTLTRAEKMATAETVGGARQYTQLMNLMENWDYFKELVDVSYGSTGTLNEQAQIYAESWEAATKKVKASLEGLWNTLINSEFWIGATNTMADLIEMTDHFVSALGGLAPVLTIVAAKMIQAFGPEIGNSINNTVLRFQDAIGVTEKEQTLTKIQAAKALERQGEKSGEQAKIGFGIQSQHMQRVINEGKNWTPQTRDTINALADVEGSINQDVLTSSTRVNSANKKMGQRQESLSGIEAELTQEAKKELANIKRKLHERGKENGLVEAGQRLTDEEYADLAQRYGIAYRPYTKKLESAEKTQDNLTTTRKSIENQNKFLSIGRSYSELGDFDNISNLKQLQEVAKNLAVDLKDIPESADLGDLTSGYKQLQKVLEDIASTSEDTEESVNDLTNSLYKALEVTDSSKDPTSLAEDYAKKLKDAGFDDDRVHKAQEALEAALVEQQEAYAERSNNVQRRSAASSAVDIAMEAAKYKPDLSLGEQLSQITQGAAGAAQAFFGFKGALTALSSSDLSWGEKIFQALALVTTGFDGLSQTFKGLSTGLLGEEISLKDIISGDFREKLSSSTGLLGSIAKSKTINSVLGNVGNDNKIDVITKMAAAMRENGDSFETFKEALGDVNDLDLEAIENNFESLKVALSSGTAGILSQAKAWVVLHASMFKTIAIIAAVVGAIYLIGSAIEKSQTAMQTAYEESQEQLNDLTNAYEKATEGVNEFKSAASDYQACIDEIEELTRGTDEYTEAVLRANQAAEKLLDNNPNLSFSVGSDGLITIDNDSIQAAQSQLIENQKNAQSVMYMQRAQVQEDAFAANVEKVAKRLVDNSPEGQYYRHGSFTLNTSQLRDLLLEVYKNSNFNSDTLSSKENFSNFLEGLGYNPKFYEEFISQMVGEEKEYGNQEAIKSFADLTAQALALPGQQANNYTLAATSRFGDEMYGGIKAAEYVPEEIKTGFATAVGGALEEVAKDIQLPKDFKEVAKAYAKAHGYDESQVKKVKDEDGNVGYQFYRNGMLQNGEFSQAEIEQYYRAQQAMENFDGTQVDGKDIQEYWRDQIYKSLGDKSTDFNDALADKISIEDLDNMTLSRYADLFSAFTESGGEVNDFVDFLEKVNEIDLSNPESAILELQNVANNFSLQNVLDWLLKILGLGEEEPNEPKVSNEETYAGINEIAKSLNETNRVISEEQYNNLADKYGAEALQDWFLQGPDGNYQLKGEYSTNEFQEAAHRYSLAGYRNDLEAENNTQAYLNSFLQFGYDKLSGEAAIVADNGTAINYDLLQGQINFLKEMGETDLEDIQTAVDEKDTETIAAMAGEIAEKVQSYGEKGYGEEAQAFEASNNNQLDILRQAGLSADGLGELMSILTDLGTSGGMDPDQINSTFRDLQETVGRAEATDLGITYEEYLDQLEAIKETITEQVDSEEALNALAGEILHKQESQQQVLKKNNNLLDNMSQDFEKLDSGQIDEIRQTLAELFEMDPKDITKGFVKWAKESGALEKALKGDQKALKDLNKNASRLKFADQVKKQLKSAGKDFEGFAEKIDEDINDADFDKVFSDSMNSLLDSFGEDGQELKTQWQELLDQYNNNPMEIPPADIEPFLTSMANLMAALGADAATISSTMSSIAGSMAMTATTTATEGEPAVISTVEEEDILGYERVGLHYWPCGHDREGGTYTTTVTKPKYKVEVTQADGTKTEAPSGGGGGGGGGGAKTPKAHKKSDMSKRYHRTTERISDNERKKEAASQAKERGYGKEKITQAETEIKLQKERIELQKEYVEEAAKYLAEDRKTLEDFAASVEGITGMKLEFDDSGVILNFREMEQALLDYENHLIDLENAGMEGPWLELEQRRVDDMREYMDRYEETLNLYEEQLQEMFNQADELGQLYLELTDIKVVLKVDVAEDKLAFMEYLLGKIEDNAYKVADAMGYLGQETSAAMDKIIAYRQGIDEIMRRRMDINDDGKLMDAFYNGTITAADLVGLGFTQDDIDKIREYRDGLIEAMETLNEMRTNALDKLVDSFDSFNEQLEGQTATLEHHVSVLEAYKDIVDLIGTHNILQGRQILAQLNNAQLGAVRAQLGESKNVYDTLLAQRDEYKRAMEDAVIAGNEEAARLWQQRLVDINDTVNSAKETYLSNFQDALDTAIDIFSDSVELAAEDFDKLLSPIYNTIDALQDAYDRQETVDNDYVQDYEKYYALQKNLRTLDEAIDDTDSIAAKNRLLKIQQEINNYKAEDVKLSQYDLDALEKRIELEKARIALEEGDDAKSTVALTRDSEGNWGYVYTADEEDIRQKEQEYEDKLKEYQDLNKDYINDLQKQILDFEAETRDAIKDVWQDTTLSESEKLTQIQQIYETAQQHMADLNQQMNNALANQAGTYELAIDRYKTSNLELIDSFEETRLSMLTGFKTTDEVMNSFNTALESYIVQLRKLQKEYEQNVDDIKNEADIQDWAKTITDEINKIGVESEEANANINKLSKDMDEAFKSGVKAAEDFEKQYGEMIDHMVGENERFIASLTNMIALLSKLNTANPEFKDLQSEYDAQTSKLRDGEISAAEWDAWYKDWSKRMDKWLETFNTTGSYTETDDIALKDQNGSVTPEVATLSAEDRAMLNTVVTNGTVMMAQGVGALDAAATITQGNETVVQQTVSIIAEFPNVSDSNEITEALNNIINDASQYANRKDENF